MILPTAKRARHKKLRSHPERSRFSGGAKDLTRGPHTVPRSDLNFRIPRR